METEDGWNSANGGAATLETEPAGTLETARAGTLETEVTGTLEMEAMVNSYEFTEDI